MAMPIVQCTSNKARVVDPAAITETFAAYRTNCQYQFDDDRSGGATLMIFGENLWPKAVPREMVDDLEEARGTELDDQEVDDLLEHYGEEGFTDLLLDLAEHLLTRLTVHAIDVGHGHFPADACEWQVAPGAEKVEISRFRYLHTGQYGHCREPFVKPVVALRCRGSQTISS